MMSFAEVVNDAASSDGHSASTLSSVSSLNADDPHGCPKYITLDVDSEMTHRKMGLQRHECGKCGPYCPKLLATHLNYFDKCSKLHDSKKS